jgi:hypothetical protein
MADRLGAVEARVHDQAQRLGATAAVLAHTAQQLAALRAHGEFPVEIIL